MTNKEVQEVLDELNTVRPEMLNDKGKRLFEAIMVIANERDELKEENKTLKGFTHSIFNENIEEDYIPKSKVREKIEEFKELSTKIRFGTNKNIPRDLKRIDFAINMLEELLQEGDK